MASVIVGRDRGVNENVGRGESGQVEVLRDDADEGCVGKVGVEVEVEGDAKSRSRLCDAGGSGGRAVLGRLAAGALDSSRYRDFIDCHE